MRCITLFGMLLLAGCISQVEIRPIDHGRYLVSESDAESVTEAAESAGVRAEGFCAERGERAHILRVDNGIEFTGPTQVAVVFNCVAIQAQR